MMERIETSCARSCCRAGAALCALLLGLSVGGTHALADDIGGELVDDVYEEHADDLSGEAADDDPEEYPRLELIVQHFGAEPVALAQDEIRRAKRPKRHAFP